MVKRSFLVAALLGIQPFISIAGCAEAAGGAGRYRALKATPGTDVSGTWAILERDGANRAVKPYLSSLGGGEMGTGIIQSPPFTLQADRIQFEICGHDGQGGGKGKNFIALADAASGEVLRKTLAPGSDPLQPRAWDVKELKGRKVRIEVHDGIADSAFAWLGIDAVDAGPGLRIDFQPGPIPEGWKVLPPPEKEKARKAIASVGGGIPFKDLGQTLVPRDGTARIACGFPARRLYFLGCTVGYGAPADSCGEIALVYREGPPEKFPLIVGCTIECQDKLLSPSRAMRLHPTDTPFLYYLAVAPRPGVIERIELRRDPRSPGVPWIQGITCETDAAAESLEGLPALAPGPEEAAWIESHALSARGPGLQEILEELGKNPPR